MDKIIIKFPSNSNKDDNFYECMDLTYNKIIEKIKQEAIIKDVDNSGNVSSTN